MIKTGNYDNKIFNNEENMSLEISSKGWFKTIIYYFKPGSPVGSMFSLFAATFDVGIITLPYLAAK